MAEKELVEGLAKVAVTEEIPSPVSIAPEDAVIFQKAWEIANMNPENVGKCGGRDFPSLEEEKAFASRPPPPPSIVPEWDGRDASDKSSQFTLTPIVQNRDFELALMMTDKLGDVGERDNRSCLAESVEPRLRFQVLVKKGTEVGFALSQSTPAALRVSVVWRDNSGHNREELVNVFENNAIGPVATKDGLPYCRVPIPLSPPPDSVELIPRKAMPEAWITVESDVPRINCPPCYFSPDPPPVVNGSSARPDPVRRWISPNETGEFRFRSCRIRINFEPATK